MKVTFLIICLALFSCNQAVDVEIVKQQLIETDKQFSELSVEKGKNVAFLKYLHDDAVILKGNSMPIEGKPSIMQMYENEPDSSYTLKWKPSHATASKSRELGYTYGLWQFITTDTTIMGTYVTIWKKNENGEWKFILDTGNVGLGEAEKMEQF